MGVYKEAWISCETSMRGSCNGYLRLEDESFIDSACFLLVFCLVFFHQDRLRVYKETRNGMVGADYSSKFSVWLAHGCISPRFIYEEVIPCSLPFFLHVDCFNSHVY